jgi:manganese transport protein
MENQSNTTTQTEVPNNINPSPMKSWLSSLGPAIITAALVLGPGSLTVSSIIGANFGYHLIWAIALAAIFMMVFTEMSARIGMSTNQTLLTTIRQKYGKVVTILIGIGAFLVTASFQAGNAIGSGVALSVLTGTSQDLWTILFTLFAMSLLLFKDFYKVLEKLMLVLVAIMLFSFVTTLIVAKPSLSGIVEGLVPSIPSGSLLLMIALFATTFSIVGAFYQSYLVQEKGWNKSNMKEGIRESYSGIIILGLISGVVMMSAAAVLLPQGIAIGSVADMGKSLEPLYGKWATTIFMIGLWGAAVSSLTGNATIGGALLADALGLGSKLNDKAVRYCIVAVMAIGAIVAVAFGRIPVQLITLAQAVTIIIVPLIGIALYMVANDKKVMGEFKNSTTKNIIGIIGLVVLLVLAGNTIRSLFFT